jgi:hypothetical protein
MMRTLNVILIALMLAGAGVVYMLKYDSERAVGRITRLQHDIAERREQIASLKAEWSLLNQPRRIQDLIEKYRSYLSLEPLDPNQVGSIDEIPMRPVTKAATEAMDTKPGPHMLAIGKPGDLTGSLSRKPADSIVHKTTIRIELPPPPKAIDPKPNDPINALIR